MSATKRSEFHKVITGCGGADGGESATTTVTSGQSGSVTAGAALDRNNECSNYISGRPENVYWSSAPNGDYAIKVHYYGACTSARSVPYTVPVVNKGSVKTYSGTVTSEDQMSSVATVSVN